MHLLRGRCLNNAQMRGGETKLGVYQRHRFCLVMENALSHDYVSEKLWDAFAGGCVPVYYVRGRSLHSPRQHAHAHASSPNPGLRMLMLGFLWYCAAAQA